MKFTIQLAALLWTSLSTADTEPQSSPWRADRTFPDISQHRHRLHRLSRTLCSTVLRDRHLLAHPRRCDTDGRSEADRTSVIPQRTAGIKTTSPVALAKVAAAIFRSIDRKSTRLNSS